MQIFYILKAFLLFERQERWCFEIQERRHVQNLSLFPEKSIVKKAAVSLTGTTFSDISLKYVFSKHTMKKIFEIETRFSQISSVIGKIPHALIAHKRLEVMYVSPQETNIKASD